MVDMSSDHILEVPDTPDRVQQSTCSVSSSGARRDNTMEAANSCHRKLKFRIRNNEPTDADLIFRKAEEARALALSEDFEAKSSSQKIDRTTSLENEMRTEKCGFNVNSSNLNHISCSGTGGRRGWSPSCQIGDGEDSQQDANNQNASFLGVGSSLPTSPVRKPRNRTCIGATNRLKVVSGGDVYPGLSSREVNSKVISNKATARPSRHVGQKKLVRNGCIAPSNVSNRTIEIDQKHEMQYPSGVLHHPYPQFDVSGKINAIDLTDNSPTITRQGNTVHDRWISADNVDTRAAKKLRTDRAGKTLLLPAEYHATGINGSGVGLLNRNNKGKEISHDILDSNQIEEVNSRRVCLSTAGSYSAVNNSSSGLDTKQGWRTTHNHTGKSHISLMGKTTSSSGQESGSSAPFDMGHASPTRDNNSINGATTIRPESFRNRKISIASGKRKHASSSSNPGGSSHAIDEPGGAFLASSQTTASRNHTTHRHIPVITIDDISPEVRPSSSGYSNGTSVDPTIQAQLESDELLACQLQEQLYNESARVVPTDEIDAAVAMSLQHEEDVHQTSRAVRVYEDVHRASRTARRYEDVHRTSRAARRFQYSTRGAQTSRSNTYENAIESANNMISRLQNAASITLGLGAVFPRYPGVPHLQPNIDLNDYDALLALDENNHQHTGASESQINNLPQSVVQSNSIQEPCAVCLENPSVGDTIRHLPCFHKFHKECIDEWLKRKKLCPICKSGIR